MSYIGSIGPDYNRLSARHRTARELAEKGIPVFPLRPGDKKAICKDDGGRKWSETTDLAQIDAWWGERDYNIGVRPIHLGWVAIDLDTYKPDGVSAVILDMLPATHTHRTPHGGEQRFYVTDQKYGNPKLAVNVDVRSYTGYVAWPPSIVDGVEYRVIDNREAVPLPERIAAHLKARSSDAEKVDCPDTGHDAMPEEARAYCAEIAAGTREHPGRYKLAATLTRNYGLTDATATALCHEYELRTEPSGRSQHSTSWETTLKNTRRHGQGRLGEGVAWQQPGAYDDDATTFDKFIMADTEQPAAKLVAPHVMLLRGSGLVPKKIEWLWNGWLALGKFHVLAGPKGAGKSTLDFSLMATALGIASFGREKMIFRIPSYRGS